MNIAEGKYIEISKKKNNNMKTVGTHLSPPTIGCRVANSNAAVAASSTNEDDHDVITHGPLII